jgi:hypothetical protein
VRWEAWPALLGTLAWTAFLGGLGIGYADSVGFDGVPPLVIAGIPLAFSARAFVRAWRKAEWDDWFPRPPATVPRLWLVRLGSGVLLALLLIGLGSTIASAAASFDIIHEGWEGPLTVHAFLPGPSEALAYVAALTLTAAITGTTGKDRLVAGGRLGIGALIGGALLVANASVRLPDPSPLSVGCRDSLVEAADRIVLSTASGEVDGTSLGRVEAQRYPGSEPAIDVAYSNVFGEGRVFIPSGSFGLPPGLETLALAGDNRLTADDLGIDIIPGIGAAARHCQLVIDGRSAVQGFPALRWLVGEDERTPTPGASLEAWRGTLDYWIEPASPVQGTTAAAVVVLAAVSVDGQPPGWPIRGLHATLRAAVVGGGL